MLNAAKKDQFRILSIYCSPLKIITVIVSGLQRVMLTPPPLHVAKSEGKKP